MIFCSDTAVHSPVIVRPFEILQSLPINLFSIQIILVLTFAFSYFVRLIVIVSPHTNVLLVLECILHFYHVFADIVFLFVR